MDQFLYRFYRDRWVVRIMTLLAVSLIGTLLVPVNSPVERIMSGAGGVLLLAAAFRSCYIARCLHRGKAPEREPEAVVRRRERISNFVFAVWFVLLVAVAFWKWIARLWA